MPSGIHPGFPITVLPSEDAAGFSLTEIGNPHARELGAAPTILAVVCPIDASNRVLKMRAVSGSISYVHRRKIREGAPSSQDDLRWESVFQAFTDPAEAVSSARLNKDKPYSVP